MSVQDQIIKLFTDFGLELSKDLKLSAEQALKSAGRKSPNPIKLDFDDVLTVTATGNVVLDIRAVNGARGVNYWRFIESGRRAGAKRIPADVVGKKWQNENNINARQVIMASRKTKNPQKNLSYDKAARALSFMIQAAIHKHGIKPKPFIDRVLTTQRMAQFRARLTPLLGTQFKLIIKGLE